MVKNCNKFICIILFSCLFCRPGFCNIREQVIQTFTQEIGIREFGGNNKGERIEMYLRTTGLTAGFPWCAAFLSWVFSECQIKNPKSAYSPSWFPDRRVIYFRGGKNNQIPSTGDVFGLYFPEKGRIAHVGFILEWTDKTVTTVEGNTNEGGIREGDGVYKKYRLVSQISKVAKWID